MGDAVRFTKNGSRKTHLDWAAIWFRKMAQNRRVQSTEKWDWTADDLIAFLRSRRDAGVPAWKRLKIIEAMITQRREIEQQPADDLIPLRTKMREIIQRERSGRAKTGETSVIEGAKPVIRSDEPDVMVAFRRAVRATGLAYNTEKAYVGKIRQFMKACSLRCLDDFERIDHSHVEAFLSELAVDGNVAPSTQNGALEFPKES